VRLENAANGAAMLGVWCRGVECVSAGHAAEEGTEVVLAGDSVRCPLAAEGDQAVGGKPWYPYL
jgi:hypothetical protein